MPTLRRPHGLKGVYFTLLDHGIWKLFQLRTKVQPRGGWNIGEAPTLTLEEIERHVSGDNVDVLESIGRFCSADLLQCCGPATYRVAWNPQDVTTKPAKRRMILMLQERYEQVCTAREIGRRRTRPDGTLNSSRFNNDVQEAMGLKTTRRVMDLFLDYEDEDTAGPSGSLRQLVRPNEGDTSMLLAPDALSGCDFFVMVDTKRKYSLLLTPSHGSLYKEYKNELRRKYHEAAKFKGDIVQEKAKAETQSAPPPPPTPAPPTPAPEPPAPMEPEQPVVPTPEPPAAPPPEPPREEPVAVTVVQTPAPVREPESEPTMSTPEDPTTELKRRKEELIAARTRVDEEEQRARAEAAELRARADGLLQAADRLAEQRGPMASELAEVEADLSALDDIDRQMAELTAKKQALLRKHDP